MLITKERLKTPLKSQQDFNMSAAKCAMALATMLQRPLNQVRHAAWPSVTAVALHYHSCQWHVLQQEQSHKHKYHYTGSQARCAAGTTAGSMPSLFGTACSWPYWYCLYH